MVDGLRKHRLYRFMPKEWSVSDIEEQIREMYNFEVSTSTISRITEAVTADSVFAWQTAH